MKPAARAHASVTLSDSDEEEKPAALAAPKKSSGGAASSTSSASDSDDDPIDMASVDPNAMTILKGIEARRLAQGDRLKRARIAVSNEAEAAAAAAASAVPPAPARPAASVPPVDRKVRSYQQLPVWQTNLLEIPGLASSAGLPLSPDPTAAPAAAAPPAPPSTVQLQLRGSPSRPFSKRFRVFSNMPFEQIMAKVSELAKCARVQLSCQGTILRPNLTPDDVPTCKTNIIHVAFFDI